MKVLNYFKGLILALVTLLMDSVILPLLDRAESILTFLPDMIEIVYTRLADWVDRHTPEQ